MDSVIKLYKWSDLLVTDGISKKSVYSCYVCIELSLLF